MDQFPNIDDFEKGVDINSILNDADLNAELAALGWDDAAPVQPAPAPARPPKAATAAVAQPPAGGGSTNPVDVISAEEIEKIGELDDNLKLTEEDMQDEGLLRDFEDLQAGKDVKINIAPPQVPHPDTTALTTAAPSSINAVSAAQPTPAIEASTPQAPALTTMTAQEAKRIAQQLNRQGRKDEAVKWLRHAKMIEKGITPESILQSASVAAGTVTKAQEKERTAANAESSVINSVCPVVEGDAFSPLEQALTEAINRALKEAKAVRTSDPRQAGAKMREYKAYQQELVVLQSRRTIPGALPACFHWEVTKKEVIIENKEIPEDMIELTIDGAYDVNSIMDTHHSKTVGLSFQVGVAKDEEPRELPPVEYADGSVVFNHKLLAPGLKRGSRYAETLYSRKKAVFDLVLHKGNFLFRTKEVLGQSCLPLNEFLKKSSIGGDLEIKAVGKENGGSGKDRKGAKLGGILRVRARIRYPLMGQEKQIIEERKLVLEPWPSVSNQTSDAAAVENKADLKDDELNEKEKDSSASRDSLTGPRAPVISLTDREKYDPHSPDFIESSDVLDAEIADATNALEILNKKTQLSDAEENDKFNTTMRLQLLQTKMSILVSKVQDESLSIEEYLQNLRDRVSRDQQLAVYFKSEADRLKAAKPSKLVENPAEESKLMINHALRIMKRIKIMREEISSAEQGIAEG